MHLIVGLGNPGEKYDLSRHNIGFMVVEQVVKDLVSVTKHWSDVQGTKALMFKMDSSVFLKPLTFMNASGVAVRKLADFYKVELGNIWVIHDDIDLPLGKMRIRIGGGTGGHHGVESIMREMGGKDGFVRFRLGVGRGKLEEKNTTNRSIIHHEIEKYVISDFSAHELGDVRKLIKHTSSALIHALEKGLEKTMNQYN